MSIEKAAWRAGRWRGEAVHQLWKGTLGGCIETRHGSVTRKVSVTWTASKELRLVSRDTNFHHPHLYRSPTSLAVRHGVEL